MAALPIAGRLPSRGAPIRVLVVDDHTVLAEMIAMALDLQPDLHAVGIARDAATARRSISRLAPEVVLMDVQLGGEDGLELTASLLVECPELRVVVLTAYADEGTMRRAAAVGACALLSKDCSLPDLFDTVRSARPGGLQVHPTLLQALVVAPPDIDDTARPALTPREDAVLQLLAEGRDTRSIAEGLGISVNTCRGYIKSLLLKLDAHSQLEAVVQARALQLIHEQRR